jgi:hypothetical protein
MLTLCAASRIHGRHENRVTDNEYGVLLRHAYKGAGTLLHVLHICYSFHQKCSRLDTFTDQGPNILEMGIKFKILVLNCPFRVPQNGRFLGDCSVRAP